MKNRTITKQDKKRSALLLNLYKSKKKELGLTQEIIGETLGITQSAVSQHLSGSLAMTTENILNWARVLEVPATEIEPALKGYSMVFSKVNFIGQKVVVMETVSNKKASVDFIHTRLPEGNDSRSIIGIEVDSNEYIPYAERGDILVLDPEQTIRRGAKCFVKTEGRGSFVGRFDGPGSRKNSKAFDPIGNLGRRAVLSETEIIYMYKIISVVSL